MFWMWALKVVVVIRPNLNFVVDKVDYSTTSKLVSQIVQFHFGIIASNYLILKRSQRVVNEYY